MKADELRKSILQFAIQGKLVKQDPNDEPASVLIKKIREEKQRLVKEGKIKKDKTESFIFKGTDNSYYEKIGNETRCIDEEIPFEVPESWERVRLYSITNYIQRGKSPKYSDVQQYPVIAQKCIQWTGISLEKSLFIEPQTIAKYVPERFIQNNDILINSTGTGTLGRTGYFSDDIKGQYDLIVADSHVTVIRCNKLINSKYVYCFFRTPFVLDEIENKASGSTNQIELNTETIKSYLIPLPPFREQQRIVNKLDILTSLIAKYDEYEKQEAQLTADFPDALKKSILQYAVQGKLVAQNPEDEPASALLDKIRKKKATANQSG